MGRCHCRGGGTAILCSGDEGVSVAEVMSSAGLTHGAERPRGDSSSSFSTIGLGLSGETDRDLMPRTSSKILASLRTTLAISASSMRKSHFMRG